MNLSDPVTVEQAIGQTTWRVCVNGELVALWGLENAQGVAETIRAALRAAYERGREDALRERQATLEAESDFERQSEILRGLHSRGA